MMTWPRDVQLRSLEFARREGAGPSCVVAIPMRDEVRRIGRCLDALSRQCDLSGRPLDPRSFEVVLLGNNCRDGSLELARSLGAASPLQLTLVAVELPPRLAHVGWARRLALEVAAERLETAGRADGFLLTTDADSRPTATWIAGITQALGDGIDAVAGSIEPDPDELPHLPLAARCRLHEEQVYGQLLCHVATLLDPQPHDPWPRHGFHCGASMGVRLRTYRALGGLPPEPVAEDRAFFERILRADGLVRHCPAARVITSCRTRGRAAGGMAATLAHWSRGEAGGLASSSIEPILSAARRARLHGLLRIAVLDKNRGAATELACRKLEISAAELAVAWQQPTFGLALEYLAARHDALRRRWVDAVRLPTQIAAARRLVRRLQAVTAGRGPGGGGQGRAGTARFDAPAEVL